MTQCVANKSLIESQNWLVLFAIELHYKTDTYIEICEINFLIGPQIVTFARVSLRLKSCLLESIHNL
jgi:hypothetical protein